MELAIHHAFVHVAHSECPAKVDIGCGATRLKAIALRSLEDLKVWYGLLGSTGDTQAHQLRTRRGAITSASRKGQYRRRLRLNLLPIICLCSTAFADQWTFFHAESVIGISCNVELIDSSRYPATIHEDAFQAEAHAHRSDKVLGDWSMTVAVYPPTVKGRHQAEKACSVWMDQASRKMQIAKGAKK